MTKHEAEPIERHQALYRKALGEIRALHTLSSIGFIFNRGHRHSVCNKHKSTHIPCVPAAEIVPPPLVKSILRISAKYSVPITPRGECTVFERACILRCGAIAIDAANIKRLGVDIDGACLWAIAGASELELNKATVKYCFALGTDLFSNP